MAQSVQGHLVPFRLTSQTGKGAKVQAAGHNTALT